MPGRFLTDAERERLTRFPPEVPAAVELIPDKALIKLIILQLLSMKPLRKVWKQWYRFIEHLGT